MKGLNLKIFARLSRVVAIIIGIFLTACSLFLPRGVEELVPTDEDALQGWALSPQGDQLIYTSRTRDTIGAAVIFDLTTNQKRLTSLAAARVPVLRTDRGGQILWETDGERVSVRRPGNP